MYHSTPVPQISAGLDTSSPTEARPGRQVRETGSTSRQQNQGKPPLQLLGYYKKTKLIGKQLYTQAEGLDQTHTGSLIMDSVCEPQ